MIAPVPTAVNLSTLPWVDVVAGEIHERMHHLIVRASILLSRWYEENHYHPELQKATHPGIDEALDSLKWDDLLAPLHEYMAKMYQAGTDIPSNGGQYRPLDLNFTQPDLTAVDYAKRRSAELVGKRVLEDGSVVENPNPEWAITPGLREDIRQAVQGALEGHELTPDNLARDIQHLSGFQYPRARMIAQTELAFAYNSGHHDQAHRMGYTLKSSLLGSLHNQPDECDDNAAASWIPIEEDFPSGDEMPPYHPRCVCDLAYKRHEGENAEDWGSSEGSRGAAQHQAEEQATAQAAGVATSQAAAINQSSEDVKEELKETGEPYTPSTPGDIQKPDNVSSFLPLKEVFDDAKTPKFSEYRDWSKKASEEAAKQVAPYSKSATGNTVMRAYTYKGDERMNRYLRTGEGTPRTKKEVEFLDTIIRDAQPLEQNTRVYRGIAADVGEDTLAKFREYTTDPTKLVNDPLLVGDKVFTSTSTSLHTVYTFLGSGYYSLQRDAKFRVLLRTTLPKGASVLPLGAVSRFEREEEVLLKSGSVHRVVSVKAQPEVYAIRGANGHTTVYLNENPLEELDRTKLKTLTQTEFYQLNQKNEVVARPYPGRLGEGEFDATRVGSQYVSYGARKIIVDAVYLPRASLDAVTGGKDAVLSDIRKALRKAYAGEPQEGSIERRWEHDELLLVRRKR